MLSTVIFYGKSAEDYINLSYNIFVKGNRAKLKEVFDVFRWLLRVCV